MSNIKSVLPSPNPNLLLEAISNVVKPLLPKDRLQSAGTIYDEFNRPKRTSIADPSDLGALLRAVRKSKGLTQQEFADLSGVGRRFVVECEAGKPRLEFAKVLQVAASAGIDIFAIKR
jgi:y4mF family transcriptional regulator